MTEFPLHTIETAPEAARPLLEQARRQLGFVPNLFGVMAESPILLEGYLSLTRLLDQGTLSPAERQVVLLSVSRANGCHYCVPAHSFQALKAGVSKEAVTALRDGRPLADPRVEALRRFARALVERRGVVSGPEVERFLAAGYTRPQVLEVVLAVGLKTLSNYTNHLAYTPVDAAFGAFAEAAAVR